MWNRGKGAGYSFIMENAKYKGNDCLIWPLARHPKYGYGTLGYNGKSYQAHRFMCVVAHGEPPSPDHVAAHECGNGHKGCVNPRHLRWKTVAQNCADSRKHGSLGIHHYGPKGKLTYAQAEQIRSLKESMSYHELSAMFGVSPTAIGHVLKGRTFRGPNKINFFTPDEDVAIRSLAEQGLLFSEIAKQIGRNSASVARRAKMIGAKSNYDAVAYGIAHNPKRSNRSVTP